MGLISLKLGCQSDLSHVIFHLSQFDWSHNELY